MYKKSILYGTIKTEVTMRLCEWTHQTVALFCVNWRHGRHLTSVTSNRKAVSVNLRIAYLLEEQSRQIFHSDPIWNGGALAFWKGSPQKEEEQRQNKSDG